MPFSLNQLQKLPEAQTSKFEFIGQKVQDLEMELLYTPDGTRPLHLLEVFQKLELIIMDVLLQIDPPRDGCEQSGDSGQTKAVAVGTQVVCYWAKRLESLEGKIKRRCKISPTNQAKATGQGLLPSALPFNLPSFADAHRANPNRSDYTQYAAVAPMMSLQTVAEVKACLAWLQLNSTPNNRTEPYTADSRPANPKESGNKERRLG